jgi:hypothetical protein
MLRIVAYHRGDPRLHILASHLVDYLSEVDGAEPGLLDEALSGGGNRSDTPIERWRSLAMSFPSIRRACPSFVELTPGSLRRLTLGQDVHALCAFRFLLHVWEPSRRDYLTWDASEALSFWDEPHRLAYLTWAARPWWNGVPSLGTVRA